MFAITGLDIIKMDKGLILNYVTQLALGKGTGCPWNYVRVWAQVRETLWRGGKVIKISKIVQHNFWMIPKDTIWYYNITKILSNPF